MMCRRSTADWIISCEHSELVMKRLEIKFRTLGTALVYREALATCMKLAWKPSTRYQSRSHFTKTETDSKELGHEHQCSGSSCRTSRGGEIHVSQNCPARKTKRGYSELVFHPGLHGLERALCPLYHVQTCYDRIHKIDGQRVWEAWNQSECGCPWVSLLRISSTRLLSLRL